MYDEFFELFYECGLLFKAWQKVIWKKYPKYATDVWDSMGVLIPGSFEHFGTSKLYSIIALESLEVCKENGMNFDYRVSSEMWKYFKKFYRRQTGKSNFNPSHNPIAPKGIEIKDGDKTKGYSIPQFIYKYNASTKGLVDYLRKIIKGPGGISDAHTVLKGDDKDIKNTPGINGVGTKISSMLLRDIVVFTNINVDSDEYRYLLQPIDEWVRRAIKLLADKENMKVKEIQNWIVDNCNDYNPEIVAMGIWYYCTKVAENEYILKKSINDISYGITLLDEHKNIIKAKNQVVNKK